MRVLRGCESVLDEDIGFIFREEVEQSKEARLNGQRLHHYGLAGGELDMLDLCTITHPIKSSY